MSELIKCGVDGEQSMIYWRLTAELKDRCWDAEKVQRCRNGVSPALLLLPDIILSSLHKKNSLPCQFVQGATSADRCIRFQRQMAPRCIRVQEPLQSLPMVPCGDAARAGSVSLREQWAPLTDESTLSALYSIYSMSLLAGYRPAELLQDIRATSGWDQLPRLLLLIKDSIENMFIKSWPAVTSVPKRGCAVHNSADFIHVYVRSLTNVEEWE